MLSERDEKWILKLRADRDALLTSLKALVAHVGDGQYVSRSNLADALAAIAKAEAR